MPPWDAMAGAGETGQRSAEKRRRAESAVADARALCVGRVIPGGFR